MSGDLEFVDGHADTLARYWEAGKSLDQPHPQADLDLQRALAVGLRAQFFALAPVCRGVYREPFSRWALQVLDLLHSAAERPEVPLLLATSAQDIETARHQGALAAFLALEGADFLEGELALLRAYYRLGVRLLVLAHFRRNAAADPTTEPGTRSRLTRFGEQLVFELARLGIICDCAHVAEGCVDHVFELSSNPVVFSHANCRALCDHPRNVSDRHLKQLGATGGLIGLSFVPFFVDAQRPTLERWLDHLDHAVQVAGIESVAIGSDFDGMGEDHIPGLEDVGCLPRLAEEILRRGYSSEDLRKIASENWIRLIRQVIG